MRRFRLPLQRDSSWTPRVVTTHYTKCMAKPELLTTAELADLLGIPANTLRVTIHRASDAPEPAKRVGTANLYNRVQFMKWWKARNR